MPGATAEPAVQNPPKLRSIVEMVKVFGLIPRPILLCADLAIQKNHYHLTRDNGTIWHGCFPRR